MFRVSFPFPDPEARPDGILSCSGILRRSTYVPYPRRQHSTKVSQDLNYLIIVCSRRYSLKTRRFLLTSYNQFFCELPPRKLKKWWTEEKKKWYYRGVESKKRFGNYVFSKNKAQIVQTVDIHRWWIRFADSFLKLVDTHPTDLCW